MKTPRILMLVGEYDGCAWWRCVRPAEALNNAGYYVAIAGKDEPGVEGVAHLFDALILPRMSWPDHRIGEQFVTALHNAGLCVIYECDDDLFSENINTRISQTVEKGAALEDLEQRRLDRLAALRLCDGMTVSSPRLATVMRSLVDYPVHTVPNAIDLDWWRQQLGSATRTVPGLTIGWSGGARPDVDLVPMAEAWGRIARRFADVQFVVMGYAPEVLTGAVPADRLHVLPWLPVDRYAGPFVNIDIGCAAVADQPFNRSKTAIKAWEYAAAGAVVVATPLLYGKDVQHGHSGYLAESVDEWTWALADLVENRPRRERMARNLLVHVSTEHSLRTNAERWVDAWASIVAGFRERQSAVHGRQSAVHGIVV